MMDINFAVLQGHLGTDATSTELGDGRANFVIRLATNTGQGERRKAVWHKVFYRTQSEKEATFLRQQLVSGAGIHVNGEVRSYERKNEAGQTVKEFFLQAASLKIVSFVNAAEPKPQASPSLELDEDEIAAQAFADMDGISEPTPPAAAPRGRHAPAVAPSPQVRSAPAAATVLKATGAGEINF